MAPSPGFTNRGHFFYGFQISGRDAGTNRRFTHLMALADGFIIFTVFHIEQSLPSGPGNESILIIIIIIVIKRDALVQLIFLIKSKQIGRLIVNTGMIEYGRNDLFEES